MIDPGIPIAEKSVRFSTLIDKADPRLQVFDKMLSVFGLLARHLKVLGWYTHFHFSSLPSIFGVFSVQWGQTNSIAPGAVFGGLGQSITST